MMHIVCYTGGTCGDLVSAMIDSRGVISANGVIRHDPQRQRLKKPHQFQNDQEKTDYLAWAETCYTSVPSHDLDYHVRSGHDFFAVTVSTFDTALWAATRFKMQHRQQVWSEMTRSCGASTVQDYAQILMDFSDMIRQKTDKLLALEKIVAGEVGPDLQRYLSTPVDLALYHDWLGCQ